jgi:hypothetical protein
VVSRIFASWNRVVGWLRQLEGYPSSLTWVTDRPISRKLENEGGRSMAALDWSECAAVESVPGKVSGAWVFKGTRTPVAVSTPEPDGAEYVAVCLPAFSPNTVHRDEPAS